LKPDIVFFEEAIPEDSLRRACQLVDSADTLIIVGTSATVSPANTIPGSAKSRGAKIIEINKERTHLTDSVSDLFLRGSAGDITERLAWEVKRIAGFDQ
jgi:NAD-dependent deacetylase